MAAFCLLAAVSVHAASEPWMKTCQVLGHWMYSDDYSFSAKTRDRDFLATLQWSEPLSLLHGWLP
jgi:hypothetical protein